MTTKNMDTINGMTDRAVETTNRIELYQDEQGSWIASHIGPHAVEVRAMFGTTDVFTPFFNSMSGEAVKGLIAGLNPKVTVSLRRLA